MMGTITFEVVDGSCNSWGHFGNDGSLKLTSETSLHSLNAYKPAISLTESQIGYADNRVRSLTLKKLVWQTDDGQTHQLSAPIDIHAGLDPDSRINDSAYFRTLEVHLRHVEDTFMKRRQKQKRRGTIVIMGAVLAIVMLAMVAFSVDVGYVLTAKEELQRTADASALAACWDYGKSLSKGQTYTFATQTGRSTASNYASYNQVTKNPAQIDTNTSNSPGGDVVFGYISDLGGAANNFQTGSTTNYNAIQVRVRKDATLNGKVPYFFARIFGMQGQALTAQATAALVRDVRGFEAPADGSNLDLLPFALDLQTWNSLMAGSGDDAWKWDAVNKKVVAGSDGVLEVNLYPQGTGSPGNRGTVDIGSSNNSTADIARQIVYGISAHDLSYLGGKIAVRRQRRTAAQWRHGDQRRRERRARLDHRQAARDPNLLESSRARKQRPIHDRQVVRHPHHGRATHRCDEQEARYDPSRTDGRARRIAERDNRHERLRLFARCACEIGRSTTV